MGRHGPPPTNLFCGLPGHTKPGKQTYLVLLRECIPGFSDFPVYDSLPLRVFTLLAAGLNLLIGGLDYCPWPAPDRLPLMLDPIGPPSQEALVFLLCCQFQA